MNIFIISAALALLLLIIQFIRQVRRTKKGNTEISRGAICFNWLLLLVFLVGVGGAIYTGVNTHRQAAKPARPPNPPDRSKRRLVQHRHRLSKLSN